MSVATFNRHELPLPPQVAVHDVAESGLQIGVGMLYRFLLQRAADLVYRLLGQSVGKGRTAQFRLTVMEKEMPHFLGGLNNSRVALSARRIDFANPNSYGCRELTERMLVPALSNTIHHLLGFIPSFLLKNQEAVRK